MLIGKHNQHEVKRCKEYAQKLGADEFMEAPMYWELGKITPKSKITNKKMVCYRK